MPGETALSKVHKYDFFAILGSGAYAVASVGLVAAAVAESGQNHSARETLRWLSGILEKRWPISVAILFLAFLVGNVLRALPINLLDNWCNKWWNRYFRDLIELREQPAGRKEYYGALWQGPFPYGDMLELELKALKENRAELVFSIPEQGTRHAMYKFWKAELCSESGAAFEYTQELEGRVRLFATMFWAAALAFFAEAIGLILSAAQVLGTGWGAVMFALLVVSALICLVFGSQLRRVRGQEVESVFYAYLSLILKRSRNE